MPLYRTVIYQSSATGAQASLNCDPSIAPFQMSVACTLASTGNYKVQYSLDPFETVSDANATWFDSTGIPSGTTASAVTTFFGPVSRIRVNISSLGGTLTLQVREGISSN